MIFHLDLCRAEMPRPPSPGPALPGGHQGISMSSAMGCPASILGLSSGGRCYLTVCPGKTSWSDASVFTTSLSCFHNSSLWLRISWVRKICSHIMYLFILMLFAISASLFSLALRFSLSVKFTSVVVSMSLSHNPLSYIFGANQPPVPFLQIHWDLSLSLSGTLLWSSSPPHLHLIRVAQGISFKVSISHLLTLFHHQFLHSRGSVTISCLYLGFYPMMLLPKVSILQ